MLVSVLYNDGHNDVYRGIRMVSQYKDTIVLYHHEIGTPNTYVPDVPNVLCVTTHEKDEPQ